MHMGVLRQLVFSRANSLKKKKQELFPQMMLHLLFQGWGAYLTEELSVFNRKDKGLNRDTTVIFRFERYDTPAHSGIFSRDFILYGCLATTFGLGNC